MIAATVGLGIVLLVLLLIDMLQTTLGEGGGWLTERISHRLWLVSVSVSRRVPDRHRFLSWAGLAIILCILGTWIVLLWGGWSLIFTAAMSSIFLWDTGVSAGMLNTIYFAGSSVFTLGLGDYVSQEPLWQFLTAVAAFNGLFVATLSITYLTPAVSAATQKHTLAIHISSLGRSSIDVVRRAWNGSDWSALEGHLPTLTHELAKLEQHHLSYPVIHYFHARKRIGSAAVNIAELDDALTILSCGISAEVAIDPGLIRPTREAISVLLETLDKAIIPPAEREPPLPSLDLLRAAGIPVVSQAEFAERAAAQARRRSMLLGFVESDGWSWTAHDESDHS